MIGVIKAQQPIARKRLGRSSQEREDSGKKKVGDVRRHGEKETGHAR